MKIVVCVKNVPDTAATIKVAGESGYEEGGVKFVSNPYDEFGIEEAVRSHLRMERRRAKRKDQERIDI